MKRRRQVCDWERCGAPAVGFRHWWRLGTQLRFWFCRRHQRRWDHGVQPRRHFHQLPELGLDE